MTIRTVLADDHAVVLDGLRSFLERQPDIEVVGTAKDGMEAVRVAREKRPDVVVMDMSMPRLNGIEATRRITSELGIRVLCLSMHTERDRIAAIFEAGASGYVLKENSAEELVRALTAVRQDMTYISPSVAGKVVEDYVSRRSGGDTSAFSLLTEREREVLQLLAEGNSTKEVAELLDLSIKTVSTHRTHIMDKLDIHSVAGLTKYAIRQGLTSTDD